MAIRFRPLYLVPSKSNNNLSYIQEIQIVQLISHEFIRQNYNGELYIYNKFI